MRRQTPPETPSRSPPPQLPANDLVLRKGQDTISACAFSAIVDPQCTGCAFLVNLILRPKMKPHSAVNAIEFSTQFGVTHGNSPISPVTTALGATTDYKPSTLQTLVVIDGII